MAWSWPYRDFFVRPSSLDCLFSYQHDRYLTLSIGSAYERTEDLFRIDAAEDGKECELTAFKRIAPSGTINLAIAVSQRYGAVVLLNDKGIIDLIAI
jgi:hypothetical protein